MVTYDHYSEYLKINFGNSTELHRRITRTLTLDKVFDLCLPGEFLESYFVLITYIWALPKGWL